MGDMCIITDVGLSRYFLGVLVVKNLTISCQEYVILKAVVAFMAILRLIGIVGGRLAPRLFCRSYVT